MAKSLGIFSTFLSGETAMLAKPFSPSSSLGVGSLLQSQSSNLRFERTVTSAAVSKSAATGKREPRGITKPRRISPEMQALVGVPEIPRTQALKHIWAYIKQNNLQDPDNKKVIICDEKLKGIFAGKDRVGFLEVAGLISPHFLKDN